MKILLYYICTVLYAVLNYIILILFIYECVLFVHSLTKARGLRKTVDELIGTRDKTKNVIDKQPKKVISEVKEITVLDWDRFDEFCSDYQDDSRLFTRFSQLIQLFPLLGILGTVAGLYLAMNSNQDWTNAQGMFEGVRFALSSTIWGIIAAVISKIGDVWLNTIINYIEDGIERFKDKYNVENGLPLGGDPNGQKKQTQARE